MSTLTHDKTFTGENGGSDGVTLSSEEFTMSLSKKLGGMTDSAPVSVPETESKYASDASAPELEAAADDEDEDAVINI